MSTTTKHLGFIPKNRDEYVSGINYYKDNIVQYKGYSFIADPVGYDAQTNPNAYVTTVPFTTNPKSPNAGWRPFALGAYDEVVELGEQAKQFISDANAIVDNYAPIQITGDVTNAADEEDLTSINIGGTDVIRLKDKAYAPAIYSGLGRVHLRKNIVNGVNVLTQDMLYKGEVGSRIPNTNTIFMIQYDYDLMGETIIIPDNCTLEFNGGSLNNGKIQAANSSSYSINYHSGKGIRCSLGNDFQQVRASWFGVSENSDPEYNREWLQMVCNLYSKEDYDNIKYGMPMLVIDVPRIIVSRSVEVPRNLCITSQSNSALMTSAYPVIEFIGSESESIEYNSGFLFCAEYSSSNDISNICIKSKGHCLNLENEALGTTRSVYYSAFKNLILYSEEGSCIYKKTGGSSIFSCTFTNIDGKCPLGSVIDGAFSGLNTIFDNIRVIGEDSADPTSSARCAKSVFNNCCGVIQNCNVGDKNIGGFVTFDGNMTGYNRNITIKDCNIEQINGGIVTCLSDITGQLSFKIVLANTSILFYTTEGRGFENGVTFDILAIKDLRSLEVTNTIIPTMATNKRFVKSWGINTTVKLSGNQEYLAYCTSGNYEGPYKIYKYYPSEKENFNIGSDAIVIDKVKNLHVLENFIINDTNIGERLFITGTTETRNPASGNIVLGRASICNLTLNSNTGLYQPWNGFKVTSQQQKVPKVKLVNTSESYYIRFSINGAVFKLKPLQYMFIIIEKNSNDEWVLRGTTDDIVTYVGGNEGYPTSYFTGTRYYNAELKKTMCSFNGVFYEEDGAVAGVLRSGITANRPAGSSIFVGFMYMDTTLGKPVYAKAISNNTVTWVDATGTEV